MDRSGSSPSATRETTMGGSDRMHMGTSHGSDRQGQRPSGYSRIRDVILDEWRRMDHPLNRELLMEILQDSTSSQVRCTT